MFLICIVLNKKCPEGRQRTQHTTECSSMQFSFLKSSFVRVNNPAASRGAIEVIFLLHSPKYSCSSASEQTLTPSSIDALESFKINSVIFCDIQSMRDFLSTSFPYVS